ncbi:cytochrome P450 [Nocardia ninae]|uniref:Cytochrome P450 n=1 Tax=Nocardia ninae NBRC 108245 TaxID=1210091 RepID=A0A511M5J1_9NOCA|nr:cytochrome P450 [Nocardia ninae]GEM35913.1 hypothetical protein NN4_04320 [Nocardia ninae NBRC 108245]
MITETLRLRPPGWLQTRTVTEDTELGEHTLVAGTTVIHSSYLIQHRPDLYPGPERLDPDRFDPGRTPPSRNALLPFAAGAQKCIGDNFAMTEATLALAPLLLVGDYRPFPAPTRGPPWPWYRNPGNCGCTQPPVLHSVPDPKDPLV